MVDDKRTEAGLDPYRHVNSSESVVSVKCVATSQRGKGTSKSPRILTVIGLFVPDLKIKHMIILEPNPRQRDLGTYVW